MPLTPSDALAAPPATLTARIKSLEDFYRLVQTVRMQGIPILNPALHVEAVGFEWVDPKGSCDEVVAEGVLITPWFMSLFRLPLKRLPHGNRVGSKTVRDFGNERFEFIGAHDPAIGYHETCALFSPMSGFNSRDQARDTALASLALVRSVPKATEVAAIATEPLPPRRAFFMARRQDAGATG